MGLINKGVKPTSRNMMPTAIGSGVRVSAEQGRGDSAVEGSRLGDATHQS